MVRVITYGTYDLLHYGHIRLLERAKALGDYLIVGVTGDDFDKNRGKINVQQSIMERVEAVRATGIADEIIIEEYEGQKIDDIRKYDIDIFTVGSDWQGQFDYLNEYCKVVYLNRTDGISSSQIRDRKRAISIGIVGDELLLRKFAKEFEYVNGVNLSGLCTNVQNLFQEEDFPYITNDYYALLELSDAIYIHSFPQLHFQQVKIALEAGKHVLCEAPLAMTAEEHKELKRIASKKNCILMETLKTAYSTAFSRLILLIKSGRIGDVISIDATCTSLKNIVETDIQKENYWSSLLAWGPTAMLPVFKILGTDYKNISISTHTIDYNKKYDTFSRIVFDYLHSVATIKVGIGVKSEGDLVISGTKGYIYVPAPWWKTEYFEIRYENFAENRRYFYQLDGEGIRYELLSFVRFIGGDNGDAYSGIDDETSLAFCKIIEMYTKGKNVVNI